MFGCRVVSRSFLVEIPHGPASATRNKIFRHAHSCRRNCTIALAQALQFELLMRQKDVIGEWVPEAEPDESDIKFRGQKWLRGLRWSDIDDNMILRHRLGKSRRKIEVDLRTAPMVMQELALDVGIPIDKMARASLPASGPMILNTISAWPYSTSEFRRKWRKVADAAGVPMEVKNTDSLPAGIIVGGPGRARISQTITSQMINYSLRKLRRG